MNGRRHTGMAPQERLLPAADHLPDERRSLLLETITRVVHPSVLAVAAYLLLVGSHKPGGGFAAGLVAGLGLVLRQLAGGPREVGAVAPFPPGVMLGAGLVTLAGYGAAGVLLAGRPLAATVWYLDAGPLGETEVPSALVFEVGIVLVVVGLVVDVLRTLGAEDHPGGRRQGGERAPGGTGGGSGGDGPPEPAGGDR